MSWEWRLLRHNCVGCGVCFDVCRYDAIRMARQMAYPEPGPEECVGCLDCVEECPFDAVEVKQCSAALG
jgi:adenylylsulfate reductase subunit B